MVRCQGHRNFSVVEEGVVASVVVAVVVVMTSVVVSGCWQITSNIRYKRRTQTETQERNGVHQKRKLRSCTQNAV